MRWRPRQGDVACRTRGGAASTSITGTAATGLPLVGTVTVKDAKGATQDRAPENGVYTVDVTGMTAPFRFPG